MRIGWWICTNLAIYAMAIGFMPLTDDASVVALMFWLVPSFIWFMEVSDR